MKEAIKETFVSFFISLLDNRYSELKLNLSELNFMFLITKLRLK